MDFSNDNQKNLSPEIKIDYENTDDVLFNINQNDKQCNNDNASSNNNIVKIEELDEDEDK